MKKVLSVILSAAMICLFATGALAFTQIDIDNDNIVTASIGGFTNFATQWYELDGTTMASQGAFGSVVVQSGDAYETCQNLLRVTLESNEQPADYAAVIYLRNWAAGVTPRMTTDPAVANQQKGLVGPGGTTAIGMKWARHIIGAPAPDPGMPSLAETQANFENSDVWKWFLDETYTSDANFRTVTDDLTYATLIDEATLNWASTNSVDVYFMAMFPQGSPSGSYQTSTLTVEAFYE